MHLIALLLLACGADEPTSPNESARDSDPVVTKSDTGDTDESVTDSPPPVDSEPDVETGDTAPPWLLGDPLTTLGASGPFHGPDRVSPIGNRAMEIVSAEDLDDDYAIVAGRGGLLVIDRESGEVVGGIRLPDSFRAAYDADHQTAWLTSRSERVLYGVGLSDVSAPTLAGTIIASEGWHEDIAIDDGLILLAAHDQGGLLLDSQTGAALGQFPATYAIGAALEGSRGLLADGDSLILLDVSDPTAPRELDRAPLEGNGWDIAFEGEHAAVALGDEVQIFRVLDDVLVDRGTLETYGGSYSVDLDGDMLWAAAWYHIMVASLSGAEPVVVGHEDATSIALAVAAQGGRAVIADWAWATSVELNDGLAGPELVYDDLFWATEPGGTMAVPFTNAGPLDLNITFPDDSLWPVDPQTLSVSPGDTEAVLLSVPETISGEVYLDFSSDDPDELASQLRIKVPSESVGEVHDDFALTGFVAPSASLNIYSLNDFLGRVIVLIYFETT